MSETTSNLLEYFKRCDIQSKLLVDEKSIFDAYENGIDKLQADPNDIVILCHDDIKILTDPIVFTSLLKEKLSKPNVGFVGVAGTKILSRDAVWWDKDLWERGFHSGYVLHGSDATKADDTHFGKLGKVAVLDGLFLAATKKTLRSIQMTKPKFFEGEWDFYDIFYTFQAHIKGKVNATIPINICHESRGELVGRDSWYQNKDAFVKKFSTYLPAQIKRRKT